MTKEEKELLLKDLCTKLPYGVLVSVHDTFKYSTVPYETVYLKASDISLLIDSISLNERYSNKDKRFNRIIKERKDYLEYKPCLFPMSSITEEQKNTFSGKVSILNAFIDGSICLSEDEELTSEDIIELFDFLNKNHFDYRGFIEKGLAIDATELNIY